MNSYYKNLIAQEFRNCVNNTITRISNKETYRPFHSALLDSTPKSGQGNKRPVVE